MTELMIILAVMGLLAAIAIPNYIHSRSSSRVKACLSNLGKLEYAKHCWAIDEGKTSADIPGNRDVLSYLSGSRFPACPGSGTYRLRRVSRNPVCSLADIGHVLNNLNMDDDASED